MKKYTILVITILLLFGKIVYAQSETSNQTISPITLQTSDLKIVFIRHGEKPEKGGNLTCKGLNRSLMLPSLIHQKFGIPDYVYVPSLTLGEKTKHARMFETVVPLAAEYNMDINSKFEETDSSGIVRDMLQKKGTILVVWEHGAINKLIHAIGLGYNTKWNADDYDTIIVITITNGKPVLTIDKEGLNPKDDCPF